MRQVQIEVKVITFKSTFAGLRTKVLRPGEHVRTITTLICFDLYYHKSIQRKKKEILCASAVD